MTACIKPRVPNSKRCFGPDFFRSKKRFRARIDCLAVLRHSRFGSDEQPRNSFSLFYRAEPFRTDAYKSETPFRSRKIGQFFLFPYSNVTNDKKKKKKNRARFPKKTTAHKTFDRRPRPLPLPLRLRLLFARSSFPDIRLKFLNFFFVFFFCEFRPGIFAIPQRNETGVVTERDHVHRHGEGAVRQIVPQTAHHGIHGLAAGENLHPRLVERHVLRTGRSKV